MTKQRLKIAIITSSLWGGGAQKSSANLSFVLSKLDYDVHIISILNQIDYEYQGKLLNLGKLKDQNDSIFGKIKLLVKRVYYFNVTTAPASSSNFLVIWLKVIKLLSIVSKSFLYLLNSTPYKGDYWQQR